MKFARVALDVPIDSLFDYKIENATQADIGRRVIVPFGRRLTTGIILDLANSTDISPSQLKTINRVLNDVPALPSQTINLLRFVADYYHHPLGQVMMHAIPTRMRKTQSIALPSEYIYRLTEAGHQIDVDALPKRALIKRKLLEKFKLNKWLYIIDLIDISDRSRVIVKEWISSGWIEECIANKLKLKTAFSQPFELTEQQKDILEEIIASLNQFNRFLLHGITGSGKTEVYLQAVAQVLTQEKQALILVPEINLTPQLEQLFRQRFPQSKIVSLHSGLNETERLQNWLAAQSGEAQIILGTRLAVFTPLPRPGLIIIDEEHDQSFKQQEGLRYSARDVAIYRAKQENIPIVLGSATPSLESYFHAQEKRYVLLSLTQRAARNAELPKIRYIDTRLEKLNSGLSETLINAVRERLARKEQSLIFINRRGYAPALFCSSCGWSAACPRCSANLVIHLKDKKLRCHHCGHEEKISLLCKDCGNQDLLPVGQGTQRLESVLNELFPGARILRIDRDSTRRKQSFEKMLVQIHKGEVDILVGTQMLAKGHDFAKLSLVGVLGSDNALYSSDFRASEILFSQLIQVGGRAGRADISGEVLIQTNFPDHFLYQTLRAHDYSQFADYLLAERKRAGFPPFIHQALLRAEATQLKSVMHFLEHAQAQGKAIKSDITLYDPTPSPLTRRAGKERAHLLAQAGSRQALQGFLNHWLNSFDDQYTRRVRWSIDVDPLDFN